MRWQTSAILALLVVLVGGFYYVYEIRMAPEREKAETRKGRVFTAEAADVTALELKRPDDTVTIKREADGWRVSTPVAARGNKGTVDETLTTILTAKMDREIEAKPASLADFGLEKPAAQVSLTLKDGKQVGLDLGAKSPTGVWVYAREQGKPAVFVLPDSVLREATRPVVDFRDRTILAFERRDVTGVDVVAEGDTIAIEPAGDKPGEKWKITRPVALGADAAEMNGLYAMREGETSVLLVPDELGKLVPRNVAAIRNKQLVEFERDRIQRVDVESSKGTVTLVKDKDRWSITAPEALPADQVEAGSLLTRLRDLRAQAFLSDDASAIPRFLPKATVQLTLSEQGGAPTTVLLAPSTERRGGQPSAYAAVAEKGPVVLVDGKAIDALARSV